MVLLAVRVIAAGIICFLLGVSPVHAQEGPSSDEGAGAGVPAAPDSTSTTSEGRQPESPAAKGSVFSLDYGRLLITDVRHVLTAPVRWQGDDWLEFGLISLGVVATSTLDRSIHDFFQRNQSSTANNIANIFEPFGAEYSVAVLGGFYIGGVLADDRNARTVAQDGIAASLIASGIITPVLKFAVGRERPSSTNGPFHFSPFNGGASFPSGHATQAFAVASVIADHYESWWAKSGAYGVAGLVGLARMYHNAHWASDVVAGGAIGTTVGKSVVALNNRERGAPHLQVTPLVEGNARGLELTYQF